MGYKKLSKETSAMLLEDSKDNHFKNIGNSLNKNQLRCLHDR